MRSASSPLHGTSHAGFHMDESIIARSVATFLGAVFLGIGVVGLVAPGFLGAHLSPVHTLIHFVSGAASLWFGLHGSGRAASGFCLGFAIFYGLLGAAGFLFGVAEPHTVAGVSHVATDTRLLKVVPGHLELATPDHLIHVAVAAIYFVAGIVGLSATPGRHEGDLVG